MIDNLNPFEAAHVQDVPTRARARARERFSLILEADTRTPPAIVRLRRALKLLLRYFGLRCVSVAELAGERREGPSHG